MTTYSYTRGAALAEGKTKIICACEQDGTQVFIESKDDITAGDGAKHNVIPGKGTCSTATTCHTLGLLKACGIPVAFNGWVSHNTFLARHCKMIKYEVVLRREAHGSFRKRHPYLPKGHPFPKLVVEFFLKTAAKKWGDADIPVDDPLIKFDERKAILFRPDRPLWEQEPFMVLGDYPLRSDPTKLKEIENIARRVFLILEKAWQLLGASLVDLKIEFGLTDAGQLLLADVIDSDSWRVVRDGKYFDKQRYRDGDELEKVAELFKEVARLTERFGQPRQRIILWRGSESDDVTPFQKIWAEYGVTADLCEQIDVVRSLHREPQQAIQELHRHIQEVPDCVVIAYIGLSNGAGPTLAANATVPVITVPATFTQSPDDVWSSLHVASRVPVMTVTEPKNAMLAAWQILAMRNPGLYAALRLRQEEQFTNFALIN